MHEINNFGHRLYGYILVNRAFWIIQCWMSQLLLYLCTGLYDITSQKTVLLMISLFVIICCILFIFLNRINNTFILNVCISLQSGFILFSIQIKYCKCGSICKYTWSVQKETELSF
jgi:hypothetical protein